MDNETWRVIERRRQIKATNKDVEEYRRLNKEVQRRCRSDKENYIRSICQEIEGHHACNETRDLYLKVRLLSQNFQPKRYSINTMMER